MLFCRVAVTLLMLLIAVMIVTAQQQQQQQQQSSVQGQRYSDRRPSAGWHEDSGTESAKGEGSLAPRGTFAKGFSSSLGLHGPHAPPPSINHTLTPTNVTWIRRADYHILTVGVITYTTDERFSAVRIEMPHALSFTTVTASNGSDLVNQSSRQIITVPSTASVEDWMLQIRNVQKGDAGEYECQVNTRYPIISSQITLNVLSPHASILEGSEVFVNGGSVVSLTCVIYDCPLPPTHIFWYHGDRVVNYDSGDSRHRINITSLQPHNPWQDVTRLSLTDGPTQISQLVIQNAAKHHSGSYTCAPVDSAPARVQVHVLQEEEQLARQSSSEASEGHSTKPLFTVYTLGPLLVLQTAFLLVVARTT
ncbi:uncharacterized protein LOC111260730 isoform X2 [Varroa jacobsoni]|uniref:uncharacterized protein LOC111260730 isoform X2 n=1 Tax=Varroa jacobsoni TaxID=62625 RepID=UPI000BF359F6|nr:uncharacterized protein LOC111260730 isoform X2 [Varroa jacobsoni]